jgi:hypothetical protein
VALPARLAEYIKRAYQLDEDAVSYWRAYEDFRAFVTEPVWDLLKQFAVDASSQAIVRTAFHNWLLIYQNARRAWGEIVAGTYALPDFVWPPPGTRASEEQSYEEMEAGARRLLHGARRGPPKPPSGSSSRARPRWTPSASW